MVRNPAGEDDLVLCDTGELRRQPACVVGDQGPAGGTDPGAPLEEIATPGPTTIAELAAFLGIGPSTAKAGFYGTGDGRLITADCAWATRRSTRPSWATW